MRKFASMMRQHLAAFAFLAVLLGIMFGLWIVAYKVLQSPTYRLEGLPEFVIWGVAGCYVVALPIWLTWTVLDLAKARLTGNM